MMYNLALFMETVKHMKILQVSGTDIIGGAGIAAYRLHQGLRQASIDCQMLVARKATSDPTVHRLSPRLNRLGRLQQRYATQQHKRQLRQNERANDSAYWSLNNATYPIADVINSFHADAVHIHWIGDNYLPIQQFSKINAPIIWTLHDMWAFTGGCHYSGECTAYQHSCGNCPQLVQPQPDDISYKVLQQKRQSWQAQPMTIVCPSQWLADCVKESAVLADKAVHVIPNGIDTKQFKPIDMSSARQAFNLPIDKKLVLFGAFGGTTDPRKGFTYLRDALQQLPETSDIELVVFGADQPQNLEVNLPVHQVGRLQDTVSIALLYAACDVFVLPSMQDNLPNTILEALACGTPCVAFDTGGIPDLIQHQANGYLAKLKDSHDLAQGIQSILEKSLPRDIIHHQIIQKYSIQQIAEQYIQLFKP